MLELIQSNAFYQMTILLSLATMLGMLGLVMKQPMIVSFIMVGALAGPSALGVVQSPEHIELLAELGIAILLFLVGLKLDLQLVRSLGAVALIAGLGQVAATIAAGFCLGNALGMSFLDSLYIAVAVTFSSTIIVVKMLSDKREVDSLHGQIAIGVLIVQDIVVVLLMMVLSAIGVGGVESANNEVITKIATTLGYGAVMLIFVGIFIRYFAVQLVGKIAHSQELLVTFAIAWAALLASAGHYFGFGKELGGLLAGISLASTPFREIIISRLHSLRDFLLLFFFIVLGSKIDFSTIGLQVVGYAVIFSLFVMVIKPLIIMAIMGRMGYRKRTSFLAGMTLAQISEFSLILAAMGVEVGHISSETLGLITLVGLITIALSVYSITYSHEIYHLLEVPLDVFERKKMKELAVQRADVNQTEDTINQGRYDVILFGLGRYGEEIAVHLRKHNLRILAVDFNPDVVKNWKEKGMQAIYGDGCDQEFLHSLPLKGVKWVISAMPQHDIGITHEDPRYILIDTLKNDSYRGKIIVSTHHRDEEQKLLERGADLVLMPFRGAARYATEQLMELYSKNKP